MKGSDGVNQKGNYDYDSNAASNPGSRTGAVSWTDASGNLWLFCGTGYGRRSQGYINDLWKYDVAAITGHCEDVFNQLCYRGKSLQM